MESTLGAHAVSGDAVERFFLRVAEQRVDTVSGKASFEAIGPIDVPGG